jgi:hypothetical protein
MSLVRICHSRTDLKKRLEKLKVILISRKYNEGTINAAINKALETERKEALKKSE